MPLAIRSIVVPGHHCAACYACFAETGNSHIYQRSIHAIHLITILISNGHSLLRMPAILFPINQSFNMKQLAIKTSLACLALIGFTGAQAQQVNTGRVNFTGQINPTTCTVTTLTRDQSIPLGVASPADLNASGRTSNPIPFSITLENCGNPGQSGHPNTAAISFSGVNNNGRLDLSPAVAPAVTARNVEIEFVEPGANTPINLLSPTTLTLAPGNNSFRFAARYRASAQAVAGQANGATSFQIAYP